MDLASVDSGGKAWRDYWSAGQGVGTVRKIESVAAIVDQLHTEYRGAAAMP